MLLFTTFCVSASLYGYNLGKLTNINWSITIYYNMDVYIPDNEKQTERVGIDCEKDS